VWPRNAALLRAFAAEARTVSRTDADMPWFAIRAVYRHAEEPDGTNTYEDDYYSSVLTASVKHSR
jgi:hypothetical protein